MCVSLGPAKFSNTILYVGSAVRNGRNVHVLGYQNTAQNLNTAENLVTFGRMSGGQGQSTASGNAMILPFPAAVPMSKQNVVDTSKCPQILKTIAEAVKPMARSSSKGSRSLSFSAPVEIYDTGIYTVVLARDPRDVPAALTLVPIEKRPDLKPEIFEAYAKWYPGWQIQVCCFNNAEAIEADPLLFWFEPAFPESYFAPTLDSHTGGVPDLEARVELDHTIAVKAGDQKGSQIAFTKPVPASVFELLPRFAIGKEFDGTLKNGDFYFIKAEADQGLFQPMRLEVGNNVPIKL